MKIKELRKQANITQVELASKLGLRQPAISAWESDAAFPPTKMLPKLADTLGCSIDALFGRDADASE